VVCNRDVILTNISAATDVADRHTLEEKGTKYIFKKSL